MRWFYIGALGLVGVYLRFALQRAFGSSSSFPWATLAINVSGAILAGFVYGAEKWSLPPDLRVGILVGLLGGFTTFSAFCLESSLLLAEGDWLRACAYVTASNFLGLAAAFIGMHAAKSF
jgi:fluoride exporter